MQAALAPRGDSRTFLTHFVGVGLDDDRYVVQRYLSQADGDIVPVDANGARPKGKRRPRPTIVFLKAVEKLRNCGVQLWGWWAMDIFVERRQKG